MAWTIFTPTSQIHIFDHSYGMDILRGLQAAGHKAKMRCPHSTIGSCVSCYYASCRDEENRARKRLVDAKASGADYATILRLERALDAAGNTGD